MYRVSTTCALCCFAGHEPVEEAAAGVRDFVDCLFENGLVEHGRLAVAADLADELKGGGANLIFGGGWLGASESLDAAAHGGFLSGSSGWVSIRSIGFHTRARKTFVTAHDVA